MYLFTRRVRIGLGQTRAAMEWALGQTDRVNKIVDLPVSLYMQVFSPDVGVLGWSTFAPDLASLEAAADKLNADDGFVSATDSGASFVVGGADDLVAQVLHGVPDPARQIEYVTTVRTICASGALARGMELGVEIAQRAEKITGSPTLFVADSTGNYGGVGWITGHADIKAVDAAQQALAADAGWLKFLDKEVKGTYADELGASTQLLFRRLA